MGLSGSFAKSSHQAGDKLMLVLVLTGEENVVLTLHLIFVRSKLVREPRAGKPVRKSRGNSFYFFSQEGCRDVTQRHLDDMDDERKTKVDLSYGRKISFWCIFQKRSK